MRCSCRCRECCCEKRCVCHPDMCLCLPCYRLRGSRCRICGLLCIAKSFSPPRGDIRDFCNCFLSHRKFPYLEEHPYENDCLDDISESSEVLRNLFAESCDAMKSQSNVPEQVFNVNKTSNRLNYPSIGDTQSERNDALTENLPFSIVQFQAPFIPISVPMHQTLVPDFSSAIQYSYLPVSVANIYGENVYPLYPALTRPVHWVQPQPITVKISSSSTEPAIPGISNRNKRNRKTKKYERTRVKK